MKLTVFIDFEEGNRESEGLSAPAPLIAVKASKRVTEFLSRILAIASANEGRQDQELAAIKRIAPCHPDSIQATAPAELPVKDQSDQTLAVTSELSFDAEQLLEKLVACARWARKQRTPKAAWKTMTPWFDEAKVDRHREDAKSLIDELMQAGFVEKRIRGKWNYYGATRAGDMFCQKKNPN